MIAKQVQHPTDLVGEREGYSVVWRTREEAERKAAWWLENYERALRMQMPAHMVERAEERFTHYATLASTPAGSYIPR